MMFMCWNCQYCKDINSFQLDPLKKIIYNQKHINIDRETLHLVAYSFKVYTNVKKIDLY